MDAHAVGAQADAVVLGHPVGQLGRRPGARPFGHLGTDGGEQGRGQRRLFAATRFVGQGGKASVQKGFDPRADGLLVPVGTFNDAREVTLWAGVSPKDFTTLTVTRERADGDQASSGEKVLVGQVRAGG